MKNVIQKIASDSRLQLDTQKFDSEISEAVEGHEKVAYMGDCITSSSRPSHKDSWTSKFQGTPLFAEAVALEEAELASQMKDLQRRMEERQKEQASDRWLEQDMFRLKKQRLELELAKSENAEVSADDTLATTPAVVPPAAEETPAVPAPVVEAPAAASPLGKTAALLREKKALAVPKFMQGAATRLGDKLLGSDTFIKATGNEMGRKALNGVHRVGNALGAQSPGQALGRGALAIGGGAAALGGGSMLLGSRKTAGVGRFGLLGAGIGAAGGALTADRGEGLSGAVRGAAVGGAAGVGGFALARKGLTGGQGVLAKHGIRGVEPGDMAANINRMTPQAQAALKADIKAPFLQLAGGGALATAGAGIGGLAAGSTAHAPQKTAALLKSANLAAMARAAGSRAAATAVPIAAVRTSAPGMATVRQGMAAKAQQAIPRPGAVAPPIPAAAKAPAGDVFTRATPQASPFDGRGTATAHHAVAPLPPGGMQSIEFLKKYKMASLRRRIANALTVS